MANKNYFPIRQSEFIAWARNFANHVGADFAQYGLTQAQAEEVGDAFAALRAAYTVAETMATRTPPAIEEKKTQVKAFKRTMREMVHIIQANPTTTDAMRLALGISVRSESRSPVPAPADMPGLQVLSSSGLSVRFRLNDRERNRRGRPADVMGALIYTFVGLTAPMDLRQWQFQGATGRRDNTVTFPVGTPGGVRVWLTAMWVNGKMRCGPACPPVSVHVAGGGVSGAVGLSKVGEWSELARAA